MSRSSDADIDHMNAEAQAKALADQRNALPEVARRQRVVFIRPEGATLLNAGSAFKLLHREAVAGRFDLDTLREGRAVIDDLIRQAE